MFRSISDFVKEVWQVKKPTGLPYGLTREQVETLRVLVGTPEWKEYQRLLDNLTTLYAESFLSCSKVEDLPLYRGLVLGLRQAGTVVDTILSQEDRKNVRDSTADRRGERSRERRDLATYGTPFWS